MADPKGYYKALGIKPGASQDAIKAAYRKRAKTLHPDANPDQDAEAFRKLTEAYQVLSDPKSRAVYDVHDRTHHRSNAEARDAARRKAEAAYREAQARNEARTQQEQRAHQQQKAHPPKPAAQPHSCACGKVSAQPRYLVFYTVISQVFASRIERIEGIFCPVCAQSAAIRASYLTWIRGLWAIPMGPINSLIVILRNLFGGIAPKAANYRVLMHQARAFRDRREFDIALGLARQARGYAGNRQEEDAAAILTEQLAARSTKRLKNRWRLMNRAFAAQLAPIASVVLILVIVPVGYDRLFAGAEQVAAVRTGPPLSAAERPVVPAAKPEVPLQSRPGAVSSLPPTVIPFSEMPNGEAVYYETARPVRLHVRPTEDAPVQRMVSRFTVLEMTGIVVGAPWVQVRTEDGTVGFARSGGLREIPAPDNRR